MIVSPCAPADRDQSPRWYKAHRFWSGQEQGLQRNVYLEISGGILTEITDKAPADFTDLGPGAVIPRLVNAHCHLEFSHLKNPLTPAYPFADWIGKTVASRRANSDPADSIIQGWQESKSAGVGLLGEIVTQEDSIYPTGIEAESLFLFREFIAFSTEQSDGQLAGLRCFLNGQDRPRRGISPHAPYTVCLDFLAECLLVAREQNCAVMMHLAETQAERELLKQGTGELVEMLQRLDLWQEDRYPRGLRPLDYLHQLATADRVLIAHGNYLDEDEMDFLSDTPHLSVVYCPRTHAFFQHEPHPWQRLMQRGVNIALGTDGRGSNPDLQLFEEVRFLQERFPHMDPRLLLELATVHGGSAMGIDVSLAPGQPAWATLVSSRQEINRWNDFFDQPVTFQALRMAE